MQISWREGESVFARLGTLDPAPLIPPPLLSSLAVSAAPAMDGSHRVTEISPLAMLPPPASRWRGTGGSRGAVPAQRDMMGWLPKVPLLAPSLDVL